MHGLPLDLDALPPFTAMPPGVEARGHALVRVRATPVVAQRPRLTAVLAIDVSGSMAGEALKHVVRSVQRVTELLADGDRLGVVSFFDAADVAAPLRELTDATRKETRRDVARLLAAGDTNVSAGLARAAEILPPRAAGERQVVVLLSDGHPTTGATTAAALAAEVRALKARGVSVSTLGFGAHHHEDVLVAMADAGGGRYAYVSDSHLAPAAFARALGAQLDVVAEDVRLLLAPADGVEVVRVAGELPVVFASGGLRVALPDVVAGDELHVLVELVLRSPRAPCAWTPLRAELAYRTLARPDEVRASAAAALPVTAEGPHAYEPTVQTALALALAGDARRDAREHADRGRYADAVDALERARARLAACPGYASREPAALDAHEALVDEIAVLSRAPRPARYAQYRKAAMDYLDLSLAGPRARAGGGAAAASPSARALAARLVSDSPTWRGTLVALDGPRPGVRHVLGVDTVIGRVGGVEVLIPHASVSRRHARVALHEGRYWVSDLESTNGTRVNGRDVTARSPLAHGDVLQVGDVNLRFEDH